MTQQEVLDRIRKAVGISDKDLDLIGRVLELENDKETVTHIDLSHGTLNFYGLLAQVWLQQQFLDEAAFKAYIAKHDLPINDACKTESGYQVLGDRSLARFVQDPNAGPPPFSQSLINKD